MVQEFVEKYPDIILEFLPPNSQELNTIGNVWKLIGKVGTHNGYFPSTGNLIYPRMKFLTYRTQNGILKDSAQSFRALSTYYLELNSPYHYKSMYK